MASDDKKKGVSFELEDDADELFQRALEKIDPSQKSEDQKSLAPKPRASAKQRKQLQIDLHGMTLAEAEIALDKYLSGFLKSSSGHLVVKIITGKGRHSGTAGSVLPNGIHSFVKRQWGHLLSDIEPSPTETIVNGLPLRGHFTAIFSW